MSLKHLILSGLKRTEHLLGDPTFIWKAETFRCIPNTLTNSIDSSNEGFNKNDEFRMTVRMEQFTPNIYPEVNDYITYSGYSLLIKSIKKPLNAANSPFWVLICENPKVK